ncbi:MAG: DUF695 domain-containing protein [Bacteroidetes bacterium]|nr:DUF695 domain-containing protein [Bacteroidota bacterium]
MKSILLSALLLLSIHSFAQDDKDHWEAYLAQYEKGTGSTLVNMSLKEAAPMKQYPFLLTASVKINHCNTDGLPQNDEWDNLYNISDKVKAAIDAQGLSKTPGVFTYQCWRADYYYIKDTTGIRQALNAAFKKYLPDHECKVEIKPDPKWEAYLTFLYPNEETMEYITNDKVIMNLSKAGDKLTKPRLVDHWLYFKTEADRDKFVGYALGQKYKIEGKDFKKDLERPFQLHLSRTDKVDPGSISAITLELRRKAKEFNGDYDGWETFVVKD